MQVSGREKGAGIAGIGYRVIPAGHPSHQEESQRNGCWSRTCTPKISEGEAGEIEANAKAKPGKPIHYIISAEPNFAVGSQ